MSNGQKSQRKSEDNKDVNEEGKQDYNVKKRKKSDNVNGQEKIIAVIPTILV